MILSNRQPASKKASKVKYFLKLRRWEWQIFAGILLFRVSLDCHKKKYNNNKKKRKTINWAKQNMIFFIVCFVKHHLDKMRNTTVKQYYRTNINLIINDLFLSREVDSRLAEISILFKMYYHCFKLINYFAWIHLWFTIFFSFSQNVFPQSEIHFFSSVIHFILLAPSADLTLFFSSVCCVFPFYTSLY